VSISKYLSTFRNIVEILSPGDEEEKEEEEEDVTFFFFEILVNYLKSDQT
jgi:hypothetical protein